MMDTVYHNPPGNAREKRELRSIIPLNRESCFACARTLAGGEPRGQEASSPSASSRMQSRFACARTLADLESTKSIVFFACAAGGQEASGAGLLSITAPKGEGGAPPPPLETTSTPSGSTSCITLKLRSMGAKRVSYKDYRSLTKIVSLIVLRYAQRRG